MMQVLEDLFAQKPADHWRAAFDEHRLSADIIERYDYPARHDQARVNRYVLDLEHPSYGRFKSLGFPIHLGDTPARLRGLAPCTGQHSAQVLCELLGWPDDRVAALEAEGVVGTRRVDAAERGAVTPGRAETSPAPAVSERGALEGIRVLDATVWFQGPVCAQLLADFGAEVIHVERPVTGDQARGVRSIAAVPVAEWNQYFLCVNRNKKSVAIDLKSEGGRELMHRLVEQADVFLWNQGLESLKGLGLDYETLSRINPRLVYATNSGYGHAGSFSKPSFDMTVQALTGIMARLGEPGEPPIYLGLGAGDAYGGLMSALGIMLALHARRRTGRGQHIDASLYGAQLFLAAPTLQPYLATGDDAYAVQQSRRQARNPLWNRYAAADRWMFLCAPNEDDAWRRLCGAVERPELIEDRRFATPADRRENAAGLIVLLDEVFAARPADEWVARLAAAGLPASPIVRFRDVADDEQAWANDYFVRAHCDEIGEEVALRGLPVALARTPGRVATLGPELGQDTEMTLFELLGIDWDRIGELKEQGIIP
jgi:crotonobetainyl-CoA:carnitine CoA-transferase CaiB-like acyl-CoA transferase